MREAEDIHLGEIRHFRTRDYRLDGISQGPDEEGGIVRLEYTPVIDPRRIEPPIITDEEYVREKPEGGWLLSDKAVQDVLRASEGSGPGGGAGGGNTGGSMGVGGSGSTSFNRGMGAGGSGNVQMTCACGYPHPHSHGGI